MRTKLFLLFAAAMWLNVLNGFAQTVASGETGNCTWTLTGTSENYTLTISGDGAMGNYAYNYTSPWYSYRTDIKTLDIQQGVTSIGNYAFYECSGLTSVTIPATVQTVANYGFAGCSNLSSVIFQTELITETNGDYQYSYTRGVSQIGNYAFSDCYNLTAITLPASIYQTGNYCFSGCSNLSSVTFQTELITGMDGDYPYSYINGVRQIGEYTFSGCTKLAFFVIPESVRTIYQNAFANCSGLENLTLGKEATSSYFIGLSFSGCDNLTAINVDDENPVFASENGVFYDKEKTSLYKYPTGKSGEYIVPESVMIITDYAFDDCAKLTSVVIPNTVTAIANYAFDGCVKLESITMPLNPIKSFTYGFGQMFHHHFEYYTKGYGTDPTTNYPLSGYKQTYCNMRTNGNTSYYDYYYVPASLKTVKITDDTDIPASFFQNTNLETAEMPLVKSIGNSAFSDSKLVSAEMPLIESIGNSAFSGNKLVSVEIPLVKSIGNSAFSGNKLASVEMPLVESIGNSAFYNCTELVSVEIPNSVTAIGNAAFSNCPLKSVVTPILESSLFKSTLEKLTITSVCTSIPANTLSPCSNLQELAVPFIGTSPTSPRTLSSLFNSSVPITLKKLSLVRTSSNIQIAENALAGLTQLTELVLSSNVRGLGRNALDGCSGLEHIYSHWANPPAAYNNSTFEGVGKYSCIIHVPAGVNSKNKYASADGWKEFYIDNIWEEAAIKLVARPLPYYGGVIEGSLEYNYDDNATLTAGGNWGYDFQCWMEDNTVVSTDNEYTFTVTAPRTLYAVFTPRENADENIQIQTQAQSASISWTAVTDAANYTLVIYRDESRTDTVAVFQLDTNGQVQQSSGLRAAQQNLSCSVPDLTAKTQYYYSLTSYNSDNYALTIAVGDFTTLVASGIENVENPKIRIYPNPAKDDIIIESGALKIEKAEIYDLTGKMVNRTLLNGKSIPVSHLPKGIYLLKIHTGKRIAVSKIVKE
jgi:hypothetical protein